MNSKRLEKIKNARSLNEILAVVKEVEFEFKNSKAIINRLMKSFSNTLGGGVTQDINDWRNQDDSAEKAHVAQKKQQVLVEKFVAPKASELKKHVDVVDRVNDTLEVLELALSTIRQSFAGYKNTEAAFKYTLALLKEAQLSLDDAFDVLGQIAEKHQPKTLTGLVKRAQEYIVDVLPPKTYDEIYPLTYVTVVQSETTMFHFCTYIVIPNLRDMQGFAYDNYYVIVTGVINTLGEMSIHITGIPKFITPGKYPLGKAVTTTAEMKKQITYLFDYNHFVMDHGGITFPVKKEELGVLGLKTLKGVSGADVEDNELIIYMAAGVSKVDAKHISDIVSGRLNSIIRINRNAQVFKWATGRRGGKNAIIFKLVPTGIDKAKALSIQAVKELTELVPLSEEQVEAMKFAMQHPGQLSPRKPRKPKDPTDKNFGAQSSAKIAKVISKGLKIRK